MGVLSNETSGGDDVSQSRGRVVVTAEAFAGLARVVVTEVIVGGGGPIGFA